MKRIADLESIVQALEARVTVLESATSVARRAPGKQTKQAYSYPRKLSDDAHALVMLVWECFTEHDHPVTMRAWMEAVREQDTEGIVPRVLESHGSTLRAMLAERAGLKVIWAKQPMSQRDTTEEPSD